LDQFSPRQSRPHFKIASIAAAGASQSKDRNDKQKTGFFDSIGHDEKYSSRANYVRCSFRSGSFDPGVFPRALLRLRRFGEFFEVFRRLFVVICVPSPWSSVPERIPARECFLRFVILCGLPTVQQAALGDCLSFDPFPFDQNGLAPLEIDFGGRQVAGQSGIDTAPVASRSGTTPQDPSRPSCFSQFFFGLVASSAIF
jgi:hypothetical protein